MWIPTVRRQHGHAGPYYETDLTDGKRTAPGFPKAIWFGSGGQGLHLGVCIVARFGLGGRDIPDGFEQAERSVAWATRFRRLVKDYERYPSTLADLHIIAFVCLMLKQAAQLAANP